MAPSPTLLKRAQFQAEALGFRALAALVSGLGPDRASAISGAAWQKLAPLNKRHARAEAQMRAAMPALADAGIAANLAQMWENLGRTSAEAFHIGALVADKDRFAISEDTHEAIRVAKARGSVFVSLHQGNWELAAPLLHTLGLPVAGVYQKLLNPLVEDQASVFRKPFYTLGLYAKGNEAARQLMRIVAAKGTVAIMADLRDMSGIPVPFFHRDAPSTGFPALLARTRDVPLFAGVVFREAGATFRVRTVEIPVARTADREADIVETTAAIQRCFEGFIREKPGQWMWGHRRWSR
ncbi:MAG: lipid A biosynthesis lauroyl [Beijerinckiaceae bacterium]|nr:MAG: lipid A biosynthesis lauroyl [Beijerinckiaceae bacterium]